MFNIPGRNGVSSISEFQNRVLERERLLYPLILSGYLIFVLN